MALLVHLNKGGVPGSHRGVLIRGHELALFHLELGPGEGVAGGVVNDDGDCVQLGAVVEHHGAGVRPVAVSPPMQAAPPHAAGPPHLSVSHTEMKQIYPLMNTGQSIETVELSKS